MTRLLIGATPSVAGDLAPPLGTNGTLLALPWLFSLPPALLGVQGAPLVGLGALIGAVAGNSFREREFLRLPATARRIALARLQRATRAARSDRVLLPILTVIHVLTPVIAAVRDSGWRLLCLVPAAVVAVVLPATWPRPDSRIRQGTLRG